MLKWFEPVTLRHRREEMVSGVTTHPVDVKGVTLSRGGLEVGNPQVTRHLDVV